MPTNTAIPPLPPTGIDVDVDVGASLRFALTILLAGAVLLVASRRRRRVGA